MDKTQNLSEKLSLVIFEEKPKLLEFYQAVTTVLIAFTPSDHDMVEPLLDTMKKTVLDVIRQEKNDREGP